MEQYRVIRVQPSGWNSAPREIEEKANMPVKDGWSLFQVVPHGERSYGGPVVPVAVYLIFRRVA